MSKTEHLSIMADFILLAAQQLRAAVEPFRCDTFGCETAETDALDKACAEVDRVMDAGLLDAAKKSRESALAAAVQAEREACARAVAEEFSANNADSRRAQSCALRAIRSRPAPAVDVLALARKSIATMIARHKRILDDDDCDCGSPYHSQCGRNDMLREIGEAESALRALVDGAAAKG